MHKIMTIVGTRPELIKMSRVINKMDKYCEHVLVHSGQNYDYELNQIFFDQLEIRKPDHFLNVAGKSPAEAIAEIIKQSDRVMEAEEPDAILLYGDTNTCLSVIAAKRRKIPIFHMEAGNRCFDQRVPEELNRKIVDHMSDINMVLSEHARRHLISEGIRPETIFKTGSHMQEVLKYYREGIDTSDVLEIESLEPNRYFLVSLHREENVDREDKLKELLSTLNLLAEKYSVPVIMSTHPRTRKRLAEITSEKMHPLVRFNKPYGFLDYIRLQLESMCVISDSGTITEESALLDFAAVTPRDAFERPEGMDNGSIMMTSLKAENVLSAIKVAIQSQELKEKAQIADYQDSNVSSKVVKIVLSHIDSVNRTVWGRHN